MEVPSLQSIKTQLLLVFGLALLLLSTSIFILNNRIGFYVGQNSSISSIINISGRQRMFSQHLAKSYLLYKDHPENSMYLQQLDSLGQVILSSHNFLIETTDQLIIEAEDRHMIDSLMPMIEPPLLYLHGVATKGPTITVQQTDSIVQQSELILPLLDSLVGIYETIGFKQISKIEQYNTFFHYTLIVFIFLILGIVFYLTKSSITRYSALLQKSQFAVKDHQEFLQKIIDNIPVHVYTKDLDSRKTLINRKELEITGFEDPIKVIGKSDFELFPREFAEASRANDLEVFTTGDPLINQEISLQVNGTKRWFLSSKLPLRDEHEKITGLLGVSTDITQRKENEFKLQKYAAVLESKNKEMEQFTYIASHDLREPLMTLRIYSHVLREDYQQKLDEKAMEYLTRIEKSIQRMEALITGLLDYSRLGKEKELETVDMNKIVNEVLADLEQLVTDCGARIECENLPTLVGYPVELKLLFQNLINNAIKFRDPGRIPLIRIQSEKIRKGWEFSIQDNGIGISKKYFEDIFVIFKKLHRKDEYTGTGIGLAHCHKIVELHDGTIWVDSEETKGSTFYFTLITEK